MPSPTYDECEDERIPYDHETGEKHWFLFEDEGIINGKEIEIEK